MIYIFFSSVFIAIFFVLGSISIYGFLDLWRSYYPLCWRNYQHVIVLASIAVLCLIAAILFGTQIPDCYVP